MGKPSDLDLEALTDAKALSVEQQAEAAAADEWHRRQIEEAVAADPDAAADLAFDAEQSWLHEEATAALEVALRRIDALQPETRARIDALPSKVRAQVIQAMGWGDDELALEQPTDGALDKLLTRLEKKKSAGVRTVKTSRPRQASLWDDMWRSEKHINSVAIYDLMPKYVLNSEAHRRESVRDGSYKYLPVHTQDFSHDGRAYTISITPARIKDDDGTEIDYYPGEREHVIELALRRIMIANQRTEYFHTGRTPEAGLRFTLSELRRELIRRKAEFNFSQIRHAIAVMNTCSVAVRSKDGTLKVVAPLLPNVAIRQRGESDDDETFVTFHPLITAAINKVEFRRLDYDSHLQLRSELARWLHFRLVHSYTQASAGVSTRPYNISGRSIIADFGLAHKQERDAFRKIRQALDELKRAGKILGYTVERKTGLRGAIVDEIYSIIPSPEFGEEQKGANFFVNVAREKAKAQGIRDAATGDS
jgi:hypothetical protein